MQDRFRDEIVDLANLFAIGTDLETGKRYLSFPVSNGLVEYEEYYVIDGDVYERLMSGLKEIRVLVERSKRHERDDHMIMPPGERRGLPIG